MSVPVRYMVANGFSEFRPNEDYLDVSPYSAMDGTVLNANDEFPITEDLFLEFSNASGKKKGRKGKKRKGLFSRMRRRQDERQKARLDRKNRRIGVKEKEAETQRLLAENVGKTSPEEAMLMQQLASGDQNQTKSADAGQGMSKGLKIGLIVGGVLVAGVIAIVVIRKMRAKKGK